MSNNDPSAKAERGDLLTDILIKCSERPQRDETLLEKLPFELLLCILDFLPDSSIALLCLASLPFLRKLGTKHLISISQHRPAAIKQHLLLEKLPILTPNEQQYEGFFRLLHRDIADLIYCFYCKVLHSSSSKTSTTSSSNPKKEQLPCSLVTTQESLANDYLHDITFTQVQHAMKIHRLGRLLDTETALEPLRRTKTYDRGDAYEWTVTTLPLIHKNSMLLRAEHTLSISLQEPPEGGKRKPMFPNTRIFALCPHLSTRFMKLRAESYDAKERREGDTMFGYDVVRRFEEDLEDDRMCESCPSNDRRQCPGCMKADQEPEEECKFCGAMDSCWDCRTEFQFQKSAIRDGRFVIKAVTWQDFGSGETPFEPVWWNHRCGNWFPSPDLWLGSIKEDFERGLRLSESLQGAMTWSKKMARRRKRGGQ